MDFTIPRLFHNRINSNPVLSRRFLSNIKSRALLQLGDILLVLAVIVTSAPPIPGVTAHPEHAAVPAENPGDWPQYAHDPQRTNSTSMQVNPPYCYAWKWNEAPISARVQPVVSGGRLFIGSMDGVLYAREASSGSVR